jgi:NADH:ubiquinone oxidoreductase subunit 6 (subunit J)
MPVQQLAAIDPGVEAAIFFAFASLTVLSAWAAVLSQNIVRMAVYLLLTLAGVAGLYFMMAAELLAAVQLIVYAGGTLILIIFGVMLTSRNPFMQLKVTGWERALGMVIGVTITGLLLFALASSTLPEAKSPAAGVYVEVFGRALLSKYLVPFEISGVLLLVVMIGAAFMARRRAKE